eukprot:2528183-Pleurochrysis_carterae.AAC.1
MLSLRMRAQHSNFGACNDCQQIKDNWAQFRSSASKYTVSEVASMKEVLFKHILDMRKERRAAMALHRECA